VGTEPTVTFRAAPNAAGDRSTTVIFKTTDGKKDYTAQATISQEGAIVDASVAEFLAAPVGDAQYRIQGVIAKVAKAEYGNVYIKDFSGETYVYGIGAKGDFEKAGLKVGDIVTLVGKRGEYKGDAQMTGAQLEKSIPVTEISIADFLQKPDDKNTWYMVTGTITSLKGSNGKDNDYGNLYISDGTNELYVYGCYPGWGATGDNRKFFIADNGIEVGDKLTMIGYKDTYKGLVELCGGVCFGFAKANAE
jgi:RPA family protein